MQKQEKSRKPLIIGIIAAVVILAVVLALLLTQCVGGGTGATTDPNATAGSSTEVPTYELYWNADRAEYDGKSEAGMSSRMPESDGYFHVRFILDGEEVVLKVADRKLINAIDVKDLMGLEFDENGIVIGVTDIDDMPLEKLGWQFYVQSAAKTLIKLNSSEGMNGMEVLLETDENTGVYDMTGMSGPVGVTADPINMDRVYAIANLAGEVTHVFIYQRPNYMLTHEAECEHCKKTVTWYEWTKTDSVPVTTGHYQLMNDIQLTSQPSQQEDAKVCLDLNGKRVDGKSGSRCYAMFNSGTELAIMDTSEGQTGVMAAHGKGDQGMVVWVRYGAFYLYGGTLDASDATTKLSGTAIECGKGKYFYMFGGTIIGGKAEPQKNDKGNWTQGLGGTMSLGGKFVMNGGEIRDGYAEAKVTTKNGEPVYNRGFGGNIYASSSAVIELNGGVIKNGRAGNCGGNIFLDGAAELTINGGKIQGGTITGKGRNGGSIFASAKTKIVLSSGVISGGTSRNCGGNLYTNGIFTMTGGSVYGGTIRDFKSGKVVENSSSANIFVVNGRFHMYGGKIDGGVQLIDTGATDNKDTYCYLTTHATIDGGKFNTRSLTLSGGGSGVTVSVGKLRDTARIGVYTTTGYFTLPTLEENKDNFFSEVEGADVLYHNERLALGKAHCICGKSDLETTSDTHINGCDGEVIVWAPWTSTSSTPNTTGNYYLLKDVTTTGQRVVGMNQHVKLDLNGKNITYKVPEGLQDGFRLYRADYGGKLQITDTSDNPGTLKTVMPAVDAPYNGKTVKETIKDEDGKVVERIYFTYEEMQKARKGGNFGMIFWARGGEIIFHNGKIDASNLSGNKDGLVMNMGDEKYTDANTGEVTLYQGSITIYNGDIKLGATTGAANIQVSDTGEMNIHGGTFTGTSDNSRGFYVKGVLNMTGGTITGCAVKNNGANVGVAPKGVMNMSGGTITGGHARKQDNGSAGQGGNMAVYGVLNMSGGTILDGVADASGPNMQLIKASETDPALLNMSGGTIAGGIELNNYKGNCKVVLSGKPVIDKSLTSEGVKAPNTSLYTGAVTGAVDASGMTGGKVGVRASTYFATGGNDTIKGYFFSEVEGAEVLLEKGGERLFLGGEYCLCGASKHEGAEHLTKACDGELLQWMAWINTGSVPSAAGNYFLEKNVTTKETKTITSDADIKIDLNGKVLKVAAARLYRLNPGNVTVTDSSKDLTGTIKVVGLRRDQGIFWVNDGDLVWVRGTMDGTEHILSGEKSGQWIGDRTGGLIAIDSKASFTMYSGALLGGKTESVVADDGTTRRGFAPTLHSAGTVNIYGGEIVGGEAVHNTGNINVAGGIFTLHGGVIRDGKALGNGKGGAGEGGNVYQSSGTFFMNGGTISGGEGLDYGGNVYVKGGTFAMTDGTITGGKLNPNKTEIGDLGYGGNICVGGTFKMSGGTISDGVANIGDYLRDADGKIIYKADGKAEIAAGGGLGGNVCIFGTAEFTGGTIIGGEATTGGNLGTNNEGAKITLNGVRIEGGQASNGGNIAVNVRACSKLDIAGSTVITDGNATGNGGNIYMNAWANTAVNDKNMIVNITGGTIEKGTAGDNGGNIYAVNTCANGGKTHLNISSGVIKEGSAKNGGAAYVNSGVLLNLSGDAKITDNNATERGGNICLNGNGVLNMSGATVEKGTAVLGGNLGMMKDQTVKMNVTGGTIADGLAEATNGTGQGGNIWVGNKGTLSINGPATISGGHAISTAHSGWAPGGSIYTEGGAQGSIDGGATISGGKATDGRNLYMTGSATAVELKNCTFTNTVAGSANIVVQGGTLTVNGAKIENTADGSRNIATNDSGTNVGNIVIKSGTITGGKNPTNSKNENLGGANIWIGKNDILTMTGGTVTGGQAKANGGNIQVTGTMTMSGGEVINGSSQDSGGNFLISGGGTLTVSGGVIKDGYAKNGTYKSNIFVNNANLVVSGGTIYGGVNVLGVNSGTSTITVSGSAVIDGTLNETDIEGVTLATTKVSGYTGATNTPYVTVTGKLDSAARIYVNNAGFVSFETESGNEKNFFSDAGYDSLYHKNRVFFGKEHCLCTKPDGEHTAGCIAAMAELKAKDSTLGDTIFWTPWTSGTSIPTSGYYYLTKDVSGISSPTLASDKALAIDLNGFTISNNGQKADVTDPQRVLSTYKKSNHVLVITDTSSDDLEKQGGIKTDDGTKTSKNQGGIIWLVGTNNKVYQLAGTLDASSHELTTNEGAAMQVGASNTYNMYGGKIIGGKATGGHKAGGVYINGTFNLYDGVITGGYCDGNGGNITVNTGGVLNVMGGRIENGHAKDSGGNIACYGTFKMSGGTVTDGKSGNTGNGMNISIISPDKDTSAVFELTGGTIAGGLHFNNYYRNVTVSISGKPVVDKALATANKPTYSMMLGSNDLTIGQFVDGARILVSGPEGVFSYKAPADSDDFFTSEVEDMTVWQTEDSQLVLVHGKDKVCVCGGSKTGVHIGDCDKEEHYWLPVTSFPETSGYYYLVSDVIDQGPENDRTQQRYPTTDLDIHLDLNGKTLTSNRWRMFRCRTAINFTVTDNSANRDGKIVVPANRDQGAIFWSNASSSFTLYGGTIDASAAKNNSGSAGLVLASSATIKLFRGSIIGGTYDPATNLGGSAVEFAGSKTHYLGNVEITGYGSALYIGYNSKVDLSNVTEAPETPWTVEATGIFTEGWNKDWNIADYFVSASASGAEIYLDEATGELIMGQKYCLCGATKYGGKCLDKACSGDPVVWTPWFSNDALPTVSGNYYLTRNVTVKDTRTLAGLDIKLDLNGKTLTSTANRIYKTTSGAKVTITDSDKNLGGKIVVTGTRKDQGIFWINSGSLTWIRGTMDGTGHTLTGETSGTYKGNRTGGLIAVDGSSSFTMYSGKLMGGKTSSGTYTDGETTKTVRGYAPTIHSSGTTVLYGGEIVGGTALDTAGNINISGGSFTIDGATITGGNAQTGGNIYISGGTLTMKSGTISGGTAQYGGNIAAKGSVEITGGKILDGDAVYNGADTSYAKGGNIYGSGDKCSLNINGKVEISGGTVSTTISDRADWAPGGNIYVDGGAKLTIDGGATVKGGTASDGHNIYMTGAATTVTLKSCTVENAVATSKNVPNIMVQSGTLNVETGALVKNTATGARNISTNTEANQVAKINIKGGTVIGGHTTGGYNGGNIVVNRDDILTITSGIVEDGISENQAGNISVHGTLTVSGGIIRDGKAKSEGDGYNICITSPSADQKSDVTISGGQIAGGVVFNNAYTTPNVKLTGAPTVDKDLTSSDAAAKPSYSINMPTSFDLDVTGLTGGKIYVKGTVGDKFAVNATSGMENYFVSETYLDGVQMPVCYQDGTLCFGQVYCLCGYTKTGTTLTAHESWCDKKNLVWTPWNGTSGLPTTTGNYYLTGDITGMNESVMSGEGATVRLDLNGHTASSAIGSRVYTVDKTDKLIITNTTGNGALYGGGNANGGGVLLVNQKAAGLNIYGGTYTLLSGANTETSGGVININAPFDMYEGTIIGKNTKNQNVLLKDSTVFNMYGGTITTAVDAPSAMINVSVWGGTKVYLKGGTIECTGTNVRNLVVDGKVYMSSGIITGGNSTIEGGNIVLANKTTSLFEMTGGTVTKGTAGYGGNIYLKNGAVNISGGSVTDGIASSDTAIAQGGNIFITGANSSVTIRDGATISGGSVSTPSTVAGGWAPGGNIYIKGSAKLYITDGATVSGGSASDGNNIYMTGNSSYILLDGAIVNNTGSRSDNLKVEGGTVDIKGTTQMNTVDGARNISTNANGDAVINISGGTITGATVAKNDGGNIWVSSRTTLNISGGTITGGKVTPVETTNAQGKITYSKGLGGNIYVAGEQTTSSGTKYNQAVLTITGGTISNGNAFMGGNIYIVGVKTHTMSAGEIVGGTSSGNGGNVNLAAGTFTLTGGEIKNGTTGDGGGNIANYATLEIKGGDIYGGSANGSHRNNIYSQGTVKVSGGKVWGGVTLHNLGKVNLEVSGAAVIDGKLNATAIPGITFWGYTNSDGTVSYSAKPLTITGKLTGTACIGIATYDWAFANAGTYTADSIKAFYADDASRGIYLLDSTDSQAGMLYVGQYNCICGGAKGHYGECTGAKVRWTAMGTSIPTTTGHYYMTKGFSTGQVGINNATPQNVVINLNGFDLTANTRAFLLQNKNTLTITDHTGNGSILVGGHSNNGGGVLIQGSTFKLYSGTIAPKDGYQTTGVAGIVEVSTQSGYGSTMYMYGGVIKNGKVSGQGGNISVNDKCTLYMSGGDVLGGTAASGGNIKVDGAMVMSGGNVAGGVNASGDYATNSNLFVTNGDFTMSGGTVDGVAVTNTVANGCNVTISGTAKITNTNGYGLRLSSWVETGTAPEAPVANIGTLKSGASIVVDDQLDRVFATGTGASFENKPYFTSSNGYKVIFTEDGLMMVDKDSHVSCVCGANELGKHFGDCEGYEHVWTATTSLPTTSGYWYFADGFTTGGTSIKELNKDVDIFIDLNGKTIECTGGRFYSLFNDDGIYGIHLTITDSGSGGNVTMSAGSSDQGQVVWVRNAKHSFTLYGGKLDASNRNNGTKTHTGIALAGAGSYKLFGGEILGGKSNNSGDVLALATNASLVLGDKLILKDNGTSVFYLDGGAKIDISRLTKAPETPWTIVTSGVFTTGGDKCTADKNKLFTATNGLDVYVSTTEAPGELIAGKLQCLCGSNSENAEDHLGECTGTKLDWLGWTQKYAMPTVSGNYVLTTGQVTSGLNRPVDGASINVDLNGQNVKATDRFYTPIYLADTSYQCKTATINIISSKSGGTITSAVTNNQGCVFWMGSGAKLSLYNVTVDAKGVQANQNGAVADTSAGSIFNMFGTTTIYGGTTKQNGGAMAISGQLNMWDDSKIIGGTATTTEAGKESVAGSVHIRNSAAVVTMNDNAIIQDGICYFNGGNVYVANGKLVMNDNAKILNGKAGNVSGNIQVGSDGKFEMNGGEISGGITAYNKDSKTGNNAGDTANLYLVDNAQFTMTGGKIAGYVCAYANSANTGAKITISGDSKITGGDTNLKLSNKDGNVFAIAIGDAGLKTGADIKLDLSAKYVSGTTVVTNVSTSDLNYITIPVNYIYRNSSMVVEVE